MKQVILIVFICIINTVLIYGQSSSLKNDKGISEIITSTQLKIKNNAILFFDSEVLSKNCQSKYIWYKIVFSEKMKFSLCLIPNRESDIYSMQAYRVNNNLSLCDSNTSHHSMIQNFIYKKTYTDNQQSESFRSTILYSNEVNVAANEAVYLLISNTKGIDGGHVLDLKTPKGEYLFKATKDTSSVLVDCRSMRLDSIFHDNAFNFIKKTVCKEQLNSNLCGMIKFENNEICESNHTKQEMKMILNHEAPLKPNVTTNAKLTKNSKTENPILTSAKITSSSKNSQTQSELNTKNNSQLKIADNKKNIDVTNFSIVATSTNVVTTSKNILNPDDINLRNSNQLKMIETNKHNSVVTSPKNNDDSRSANTKSLNLSGDNSKTSETKINPITKDISLVIKLPTISTDHTKHFQLPNIKKLSTGDYLATYNINSKNDYEITIQKNEIYEIEINQLGYKKYKETFHYLPNDSSKQQLVIKLIPLEEGDIFVVKNITFHPNTPVFKKQSESELQKIVSFMKECPTIYISIEGHTNGNHKIPEDKERNRMGGEWAFHGSAKELSVKRSKVIQNYLVENGIDITRLDIKGFGGNNPIYDIKDPEISYKNMRVEIRIIKAPDKVLMSSK